MPQLQDTLNQAKRVYDAKKQGEREEARYEAGTRILPYEQRRMDVIERIMAKQKQLSPEELEALKPSTDPLVDPDEDPTERARRMGRTQAMEATDG